MQRSYARWLVLLASLLSAATCWGSPSAKPSVIRGALERTSDGYWRAGEGGALVTIGQSLEVEVASNAVFRILGSKTRLWLDPDQRHVIYTLIVREGRVDMRARPPVPPLKEALLIRSPLTPFGIVKRGTATLVNDAREWSLATRDGEVLLYKDKSWERLPAWSTQPFIDGQGTAGAPLSLPTAPVVNDLERVGAVIGSGQVPRTVAWKPVAGAKGYRVELSAAGGISYREVPADQTSVALELRPGRYSVVVYAIGPHRLEGRRSAAKAMTIFALQLPPGAYVGASGELRLPRAARVAVSHCEDLVVAYGSSAAWSAAPSHFSLLRNKETVVRVRASDGGVEYPVSIAPRNIRAEVAIGPRTATWPLDRVAVTVRLVDERGDAIPEWLEPEIRTWVGVREVTMKWTRSDQGYRGVVPPPTDSRGPWVVRVDVQDGFGSNLGYEFLEVARAEQPTPRAADTQSLRGARGVRSDTL